jgi:5-methylcytosine-specific restriction endonuclease McrA
VIDKPGLVPELVTARRRASNHKRRAQKKGSGGSFTQHQVALLKVLQQGCCANCGCDLGDRYHRDHRTPLALGGSNQIENIELLCAPCNLRKNAKDEIEWAQENGRLL